MNAASVSSCAALAMNKTTNGKTTLSPACRCKSDHATACVIASTTGELSTATGRTA